jgi:hypothetical protein
MVSRCRRAVAFVLWTVRNAGCGGPGAGFLKAVLKKARG